MSDTTGTVLQMTDEKYDRNENSDYYDNISNLCYRQYSNDPNILIGELKEDIELAMAHSERGRLGYTKCDLVKRMAESSVNMLRNDILIALFVHFDAPTDIESIKYYGAGIDEFNHFAFYLFLDYQDNRDDHSSFHTINEMFKLLKKVDRNSLQTKIEAARKMFKIPANK